MFYLSIQYFDAQQLANVLSAAAAALDRNRETVNLSLTNQPSFRRRRAIGSMAADTRYIET
jgi:hypothetical protein